MADKNNSQKAGDLCPTCGKRMAESVRAGSLTSYFSQPFNCTCAVGADSRRPGAAAADRQKRSAGAKTSGTAFCRRCGLKKVSATSVGSITGFLFQDTRCKCPPEDDMADNEMAKRFWKLKQAGLGNTFSKDSIAGVSKAPEICTSIDLLPGAIIGGVYSIVRLIGKGGMGEVYLAKHLTLGKMCALKLVPPDQVTDNSWQRFQNEAKSIAALDHVNLVKVTDLGIHEGCLPYCAMEFVDGQTLAEMIETHGPMPFQTALDVFMQVCDGVDYAHRKGLVHRDLKPANIMLIKSQSGKLAAKILDFGLVKLTGNDRQQQSLTSAGDVFGSPFYMSPEQCIGGKIDNRSDIYSLGCTMFESLTGRPPYVGITPVEIVTLHQTADPPSLDSVVGSKVFPQSMEVVIAKLLRKNPVERYQTLLELRKDLEKVSRGEEVQPFYVSRTKQTSSAVKGSNERETDPTARAKRGPRTAVMVAGALATVAFFSSSSYLWWQTSFNPKKSIALLPVQTPPKDNGKAMIEDTLRVDIEFPTAGGVTNYENRNAHAPTLSLKDTTPFCRSQMTGEGQKKIFLFPTDIVIGDIKTAEQHNFRPAEGSLVYRTADILTFRPDPILAKYPQYLKRFKEGDINGLQVSETTSTDEMLMLVCQIPGVEQLSLINSYKITDRGMSYIDRMRSLSTLELSEKCVNATTLSRLTRLNDLGYVGFSNQENTDDYLRLLANAPSLKQLALNACKVSRQGFEYIAQMPNLEGLRLDGSSFSPENLAPLKKAKHLKGISFLSHVIDTTLLNNIRPIKTLEEINITNDPKRSLSPAEIRMAMPRIRLSVAEVLDLGYDP